ncbi:plakophilin-2 isoform X1 [Pelobates cultripes]|uniref:Plakophilin-2 n=1 Tax=Pelobates cultripes TaxID=61616 RepID=A0AAD1W025_PELCU|nr:plakophilin-2 isoform X1 [Pelobates cultripes]CAH2278420.1 plakophilin-2 isoform X1 [Pelobates cultripes]
MLHAMPVSVTHPSSSMATVYNSSVDNGYIKTVLGHKHFMDLDSSSLALPSEEKLKTNMVGTAGGMDKATRLQQQLQLTMARKKSSTANGGIHQSESSYNQSFYNTMVTPKFSASSMPSPTKHYESIKKVVGNENGWSRSHGTYVQWKAGSDATSPRHPTLRREISPERRADVTLYDIKSSVGTGQRYTENKYYGTSNVRTARSEIVGDSKYGRPRQSVARGMSQLDGRYDSVFLNNVLTSPASPIYQQSRNSRSMTNLNESEMYQMQSNPVGQARPPPRTPSNKGQTMRSKWQQSTVKTVYSGRESAGSGGMDLGGCRTAMTAGIVGGMIQGTETQVGNAPTAGEIDMTLDRAINLLLDESSQDYWIITAASFIQHECFQKTEARRRVYALGGIPRLLRLLNNDNEEVQRASCAALRNLVFEDNDNKLEVCEQNGMPAILRLLKETRDLETKRQITGLLWNLSSNDQLKPLLIRDALNPLTKNIVIPSSGWKEGENPKNEILSDSDIFYNATGCLRNMSSAGPEARKAMRECDGLIDSLVYYVRGSVADYKPDDKATENCVCILHNLSYQLEAELSGTNMQNIYAQSQDNAAHDNKTIGCFGSRSRKIKETWRDAPIVEEKSNPRGVEWLWHSIVLRMYLSLIAKSSRNYTQEASLGALQNLTAGNGMLPVAVAQTVVKKENGLQHIQNILHTSDPGVKRTAVSLLRNLSRNQPLQNEMAKYLLPDLVTLLPNSTPDTNIANETAASICYVLNNLVSNSSQNAKILLSNGGVQKLINFSANDSAMTTKAGRVASVVLFTLWQHQDLHSAYKKALYKKTDFVNSRTSKAYHSL